MSSGLSKTPDMVYQNVLKSYIRNNIGGIIQSNRFYYTVRPQKSLNDKEQMILQNRLLSDEPQTLQDIADIFGISRERVRQIEVNLLKKMKKYLEQEVPDIGNFFGEEEYEKG